MIIFTSVDTRIVLSVNMTASCVEWCPGLDEISWIVPNVVLIGVLDRIDRH